MRLAGIPAPDQLAGASLRPGCNRSEQLDVVILSFAEHRGRFAAIIEYLHRHAILAIVGDRLRDFQ
ncbi:hypothetical protein AZL_018370 [Azospirillum sp. B510]|nr:hypothetical protein AZL_018370 [Azospirillum sp. B510]